MWFPRAAAGDQLVRGGGRRGGAQEALKVAKVTAVGPQGSRGSCGLPGGEQAVPVLKERSGLQGAAADAGDHRSRPELIATATKWSPAVFRLQARKATQDSRIIEPSISTSILGGIAHSEPA